MTNEEISALIEQHVENGGTLDCVVSRWWLHRALIKIFGRWMKKSNVAVCNAAAFRHLVGHEVQFFSVHSDKPIARAIITGVREEKRKLEFAEPLPHGVKRGDLIVGANLQ